MIMKQRQISDRLWGAIYECQIDEIKSLCNKYPWLVADHLLGEDHKAGIVVAAETRNPAVVQAMLDIGFNIDAADMPQERSVLVTAIEELDSTMVRFLLSKGANPNVGRPLVTAMNRDDNDLALSFVKLLVEHGADVNKLYELYGDKDDLFTALDWATDPSIIEYLKQHGAKHAAEIIGARAQQPKSGKQRSLAEQVVAYFEENFGPVNKRAQIEIVPSGTPISIHAIEPKGKRRHLTLFTTGLSSKEMVVPRGEEDYALAEIFMQLPGSWNYQDMSQANTGWPCHWLRRMAQYPEKHQTWLGGPFTIVANEDPPEPLAPNTKFTSLLLLAEKSFQSDDGRKVQLYRMSPLYTEERDLEIREGAAALMRAFDRQSVPFIVDLKRKNVALS